MTDRTDPLRSTRPTDNYYEHVSCPSCGAQYTRGHHRIGDHRLCMCCSTIYVMPPHGEAATRGDVKSFNKQSAQIEPGIYMQGRPEPHR